MELFERIFNQMLLLFAFIVLVLALIPQSSFVSETFFICGMCFACMPIGLNAMTDR